MVRKDIKTTQPRRGIKTAIVSDPNNSDNQQPNLNIEHQAPKAPLKERVTDFIKENRLKIAVVAGALLVLTVIVWVLFWYFAGGGMRQINGVTLEKYSNSDYSILVPKDYIKTEKDLGTSGKETAFTSSTKIADYVSKVYILAGPLTDTCKKSCLSGFDSTYTNDAISKSKGQKGYNGMANINYSKRDIGGIDARFVSYDELANSKISGKYYMAMMLSDDKFYEIIITVNDSDPGLAVSVEKIIGSFDPK